MDIWNILEEKLIKYDELNHSINLLLLSYEKRCLELISSMQNKSFADSQDIFDELYRIQELLATVLYKYKFDLSDSIREFIYHFERNDDCSRQYWYLKFKDGLTWPTD